MHTRKEAIYLTCDAYHSFSATSFNGYSLVVVKLCLAGQFEVFCKLKLGDSLPCTQV